MLYFDAGFLAPLILEETTSSAVERFMVGLPSGALAVSHWTRVEFSSLLAREVRIGGLEQQGAKKADAQFEAIVAESFVVLLPLQLGHATPRELWQWLRAGDALHLAIAKNPHAEAIYCFDKTLLKAGKALGLPVSRPRHECVAERDKSRTNVHTETESTVARKIMKRLDGDGRLVRQDKSAAGLGCFSSSDQFVIALSTEGRAGHRSRIFQQYQCNLRHPLLLRDLCSGGWRSDH